MILNNKRKEITLHKLDRLIRKIIINDYSIIGTTASELINKNVNDILKVAKKIYDNIDVDYDIMNHIEELYKEYGAEINLDNMKIEFEFMEVE